MVAEYVQFCGPDTCANTSVHRRTPSGIVNPKFSGDPDWPASPMYSTSGGNWHAQPESTRSFNR